MRTFDASIEATRKNLKKQEALILKLNKKPLSEEDVNHYAKVYGFEAKARRSVVTIIRRRKKDYWQLIVFFIGCIRNILIKRG